MYERKNRTNDSFRGNVVKNGREALAIFHKMSYNICEIQIVHRCSTCFLCSTDRGESDWRVDMNKIITISRQYGSGGREIGEKLANIYNIPFYDRALITRAAEESGFAEAAFDKVEDKATNSLLYSIAMGMNAYGGPDLGYTHMSLDDRIYLAQSDIIRKVADEGPCVIIGRCADYILKDRDDVINIFIWASLPYRIKRAIERDGVDPKDAEATVLKKDKRRANYYNYHANDKWGKVSNYHLAIQSDFGGVEKSVQIIRDFIAIESGDPD